MKEQFLKYSKTALLFLIVIFGFFPQTRIKGVMTLRPKLIQLTIIVLCTILLVSCQADTTISNDINDVLVDEAYIEELIEKFSPLGDVPIPEDNELTEEAVELGKKLFFDPRLSGNDELSCASCHVPTLGWSDGKPLFEGFEGAQGPRRTPTIINAAYHKSLFWDGRADSLEEQALGPISSPIEMNMNLDKLADKLAKIDGYTELFYDVYGEDITIDNIAKALASFQRTIVTTNTRFDQFLAGDYDALTEEEILGMDLFANKARCIACHNGPHLTDNRFHNVGIESDDIGLKEFTGRNADDGAFRTPGLYGITQHPPYMHDGSLETIEDVVEFYNRGGDDHINKSAMIKELNLTEKEKKALVAFLHTLEDRSLEEIEMPDLPDFE